MTREGQGMSPEETTPPARTRWTQAEAGDDAGLIPPFVPGRRREPSEPETAPPAEPHAGLPEEQEETPVAEVLIPDPPAEPEPLFPWAEEGEEADGPEPWAEGPGDEAWGEQGLDEAWEVVQGGDSRAEQLAARLEALARAIRTDGLAGVKSELNSSDRFTAVLAALLSGYLAGGED